MFALPLNTRQAIPENTPKKRVGSRGYEYEMLYLTATFATATAAAENNGPSAFSILTNPDRTRVFAYMAPRQTQTVKEFFDSYVEGQPVGISEAVEGTMITFFWNPEIDEWDICTRNSVGGNYSYLQHIRLLDDDGDSYPNPNSTIAQKTFLQLLLDAFRMRLCTFVEGQTPPEIRDLADVVLLHNLPKEYCYTCILQHPENHIVYDLLRFTMRLYPVSIYKTTDGIIREVREEDDAQLWLTANSVFDPRIQMERRVETALALNDSEPFKHAFESAEYVEITHSNVNTQDSAFYPPAWILTNQITGHRVEIPNRHYQRAKELRNLQPNMRYLWLDIRRKNQIEQYVAAFPRYRPMFAKFREEYDRFVGKVYDAYVGYYILKRREPIIPKKYFVHAARIHHNVYLPSIASGQKSPVRLHTVQHYFDQFTASKMFYYLCKIGETSSESAGMEEDAISEQPHQI